MRSGTVAALAAIIVAFGGAGAEATTTHVPCNGSALQLAVGGATAGEVLTLAPGCTYVFTNSGGGSALVISQNIKIVGNGATLLRNATTEFRIVVVNPGVTASISNVTIIGGHANDATPGAFSVGNVGGGVLSAGTLTLSHVKVTGNFAGDGGTDGSFGGSGGAGGGIENLSGAKLVLVGSKVTSNRAGTGAGGSFIAGPGGSGGGIANFGTLVIKHSRIANNFAGNGGPNLGTMPGGPGGRGGGIVNEASSTTKISDSLVASNDAGDGGAGTPAGVGGTGGGILNQSSTAIHPVRTVIKKNSPDNCAPSGSVKPCH